MAWPFGAPGTAGYKYTYYDSVAQIPSCIREKVGTVGGCNFNWPQSTKVFSGGQVYSIEDNEDGTLKINCKEWDGDSWEDFNWVSARHPGMDAGTKWWTSYVAPPDFPYEPSFYKIAIFPKDEVRTGGYPGNLKYAHTLHIDDNGDSYVTVIDDGLLTLNGKTLGDYAADNYRFEIIRSGGGSNAQQGYSFAMRFPPYPNATTYAWGYNGKVFDVTVTVTAEDDPPTWTLTFNGQTTAAIAIGATATQVDSALEALSSITPNDVKVMGPAGGPYTVCLDWSEGDLPLTASGATVAEPDNKLGDASQTWADDSHNGKDLIFKVGDKWHRVAVTDTQECVLTFASIGEAPTFDSYFAVITSGGFYKPDMTGGIGSSGFPRFRVELADVVTRSGIQKVWNDHRYWIPQTWYQTFATTGLKSHTPDTDVAAYYSLPATYVTIEECADEFCNCDEYLPDGGKEDVDAFDNYDLTTAKENFCPDYVDLMYQPWLHWSIRGWELAVESIVGNWVDLNYDPDGNEVPPYNWTLANCFKWAVPGATVTTSISSVSGGGVASVSVTMPTATAGQTYSSLRCWYSVNDDTGTPSDYGSGYVTATTLTKDSGSFSAPQAGKEVVIAFGWGPRKIERQVRYLYSRQIMTPEEDDAGEVFPPVEEYPGDWLRNEQPSTTYCEYDERGSLEDTATALIAGESARYVGDHWEAPTGREGKEDLLYQGVSSPTSDFPQWTLTGTVGQGGNYWLEDTLNQFWVSATPLVTHTGTGTTGSNTNTLKDSALYKPWLTHVGAGTELQTRLSRFWSGVNSTRFVGMILEVAVSGDGSPEDPYVWERRPITAQNVTTASNPYVTVAPAFSATTLDRPYKIREPGYSSRGSIVNRFKGRRLIITHADGTTDNVAITHSDDIRLYWSTSDDVTATAGDTYRIDEVEAGTVLQYKPSADAKYKHGAGFVIAEHATQDTRGHNFLTGSTGGLQNLPTIASAYSTTTDSDSPSRLRKFDVITRDVYTQLYSVLNALKVRSFVGNWSAHGECNNGSWAGDSDTPLYTDEQPACDESERGACKEEDPLQWYYCTWDAAYLRNTLLYEGCTEGCCVEGDCSGCEIGSPNDGAPYITQGASLGFMDSCGLGEPECTLAATSYGVGGSVARQYSYYDGAVTCCWDSGVEVKSYAKAMPPGGLPSGETVLCSQFDPFSPCALDPEGQIEICTTHHTEFGRTGKSLKKASIRFSKPRRQTQTVTTLVTG